MQLTVKGWLPNRLMPPQMKIARGPVRSFTAVHHTFANMATSQAQQGGDYDIPNEPPVYDQGKWGSCVLNAVTGALNIVLAVEGLSTAMLSRMFLYWLCRDVMGTTHEDSGTYPHLAVERLTNIGVCREDMWAYTDAHMYSAPTPDTYPAASDNKPTAWFSIDAVGSARLDQLEACIRSNHPVLYGSPVSSAIQNYKAGEVLTIPNASHIIGGHSTVFTGVRYINGKRVWRVRNSWGPDYGDNGHFLIDDAWAGWSELDDLQVITHMPALLF